MIVHKNPYFSVKVIEDYYSITFPTEQVIILPVVDTSHILFIQAIRPVFKKSIIELPAGTVESGETLEMAALRELSEETGIRITDANRLKSLPSLNTIPSRTNHLLHIYHIDIARDEYENRKAHDQEVAGLQLLTFNETTKKIQKGEIFVAGVVAIVLRHLITIKKKGLYEN